MTTAQHLANIPPLRCYVRREGPGQYYARCINLAVAEMAGASWAASRNLWHCLADKLYQLADDGSIADFVQRGSRLEYVRYAVLAVNGWLSRRRLTWKIRSSYDTDADVLTLRSGYERDTYETFYADGPSQYHLLIHDRESDGRVVGLTLFGLGPARVVGTMLVDALPEEESE